MGWNGQIVVFHVQVGPADIIQLFNRAWIGFDDPPEIAKRFFVILFPEECPGKSPHRVLVLGLV